MGKILKTRKNMLLKSALFNHFVSCKPAEKASFTNMSQQIVSFLF